MLSSALLLLTEATLPSPALLTASRVLPRARLPRLDAITTDDVLMRQPLKKLAKAFYSVDTAKSGQLDLSEFALAVELSGAPLDAAAVTTLFQAADVDGDGTVTIDEFLSPRAVPELLCELPSQPKDVTQPFRPSSTYLWRLWRGTILESTWQPALASLFASIAITCALRLFGAPTWPLFTVPDPKHPLIARLLPIAGLWDKQLTLTTFVTTFFVGQALAFFKSSYGQARSIASRLSDLNLLLASHVARDKSGKFTPAGRQMLEAAARNSRLFHMLYWASMVDWYASVSSEAGLTRLRDAGHCTEEELALLLSVPRKSRHHTVAMWIIARGRNARTSGAIADDQSAGGFDPIWNDRAWSLRSAYGKIGQQLGARLPTVYLHLVQVLVDTLLVITPLALYARLGATSVPLSGGFAVFYRGLVDVSKSFLDPFGNDNTNLEIQVPVLVKDCNSASVRFLDAAEVLPAD